MAGSKRVRALGALIAAVLLMGVGAAAAGTGNDTVLRESQYDEFFKKEGSNKNYLYTRTEWRDGHGRYCTVVSGDSEKTIALDCDFKPVG